MKSSKKTQGQKVKKTFAQEQFQKLLALGFDRRVAGDIMYHASPSEAVSCVEWLEKAWEEVRVHKGWAKYNNTASWDTLISRDLATLCRLCEFAIHEGWYGNDGNHIRAICAIVGVTSPTSPACRRKFFAGAERAATVLPTARKRRAAQQSAVQV